jgi:diaminopimelate epimerase
MTVKFHKMHGLGNDFVVLDLRQQLFSINKDTVRQLANRHTGIGCDQVLVLRKPLDEEQVAAYEFWNSDGSRAEQCGNGMRCLGLFLHMLGDSPAGPVMLGGSAGAIKVEYLQNKQVRVDMGKPVFASDRVPVLLEPVDGWYALEIEQQFYKLGAVSMGNPHSLMLVDDLSVTNVAKLGPAINENPAFPEGCNAGFAELVDETINVTQAGGNLILSWTGGDNPVIMTGPATHVFEGYLT